MVLTTDEQLRSENPTVIFTKQAAAEIVSLLAERGHTEAVIIGGAITMSMFMEAGLVDDIYFVVEPVLFGSGLPLIKGIDKLETPLILLDMKKLNAHTVQLHYQLKKQQLNLVK